MKPPLMAPPKPAPPKAAGSNGATAQPTRAMGVSRGTVNAGQKIVLFGPGGVGKTELWWLLDSIGIKTLGIDIEGSANFLDVTRVDPAPESFDEVRAVLHDYALLNTFGAVAIDSLTKLEEFAIADTFLKVPHEKGNKVSSIEGYGFGKGYMHVYETFLQILGDLDAVSRRGIHIICTCHDCTATVPNPAGEDWIRWEPRLQSPPSGKGSIRHRVKEWADHLLFIGFDQYVTEDGKAKGSGTRTIYPAELPTHWAKSRLLSDPIPYTRHDATLWQQLFQPKE
jgi:hypothetical protein